MFISSCTTIYFFVKKIVFSNIYISVNTTFECPYMFFGWKRGHQLSTYATVGGMDGHLEYVKLRTGGGGSRLMCAYALTLSLFMFLTAFLSYIVFFYLWKFNLTFIHKRCVRQNSFFLFIYPTRSISWNKLFLLKITFGNQS